MAASVAAAGALHACAIAGELYGYDIDTSQANPYRPKNTPRTLEPFNVKDNR
jgi:hypothetical protein